MDVDANDSQDVIHIQRKLLSTKLNVDIVIRLARIYWSYL